MISKSSSARLLLSLFLVNALGFALKYFKLDTYFILLGFRFHLSAFVPFLVLIKRNHFLLIKDSFTKPRFAKIGKIILIFISINLLFISILYFLHLLKIGDPEYFFEFGISSIFDYPVYLIWNSSQLALLYLYLLIVQASYKDNFILVFVTCLILYLYELIPLNNLIFDYSIISSFVLLCAIVVLVMKFFSNIYLFIILIFSSIWINILAFGSTSKVLTNLFLASTYDSWEGFFAIDKSILDFVIPSNLLLLLIAMLVLIFLRRTNPTEEK